MGGQTCVFYGAAQVSKDVDFLFPAKERNDQKLLVIVELSSRFPP
jgi:hypothetical protein